MLLFIILTVWPGCSDGGYIYPLKSVYLIFYVVVLSPWPIYTNQIPGYASVFDVRDFSLQCKRRLTQARKPLPMWVEGDMHDTVRYLKLLGSWGWACSWNINVRRMLHRKNRFTCKHAYSARTASNVNTGASHEATQGPNITRGSGIKIIPLIYVCLSPD